MPNRWSQFVSLALRHQPNLESVDQLSGRILRTQENLHADGRPGGAADGLAAARWLDSSVSMQQPFRSGVAVDRGFERRAQKKALISYGRQLYTSRGAASPAEHELIATQSAAAGLQALERKSSLAVKVEDLVRLGHLKRKAADPVHHVAPG